MCWLSKANTSHIITAHSEPGLVAETLQDFQALTTRLVGAGLEEIFTGLQLSEQVQGNLLKCAHG
jgi:hypothetical protein